jgi:hypothetical protein
VLVEVLGGRIIHAGHNNVLGTESSYISLADQVVELAQPLDDNSPAAADWQKNAPDDTYHSLTWQVRDLDQVAEHLKATGVGLRARTDTLIVVDPTNGLGVPWGFTPILTAGDPRA